MTSSFLASSRSSAGAPAGIVLAQIIKGVQFASGARDGDTALKILQVIGVDIVIGQLARGVEGAERYSRRYLVSLLSGFGRMPPTISILITQRFFPIATAAPRVGV